MKAPLAETITVRLITEDGQRAKVRASTLKAALAIMAGTPRETSVELRVASTKAWVLSRKFERFDPPTLQVLNGDVVEVATLNTYLCNSDCEPWLGTMLKDAVDEAKRLKGEEPSDWYGVSPETAANLITGTDAEGHKA